MTGNSEVEALVNQYLRATRTKVASRIAYQISEQLYDQDSLLVLEPLFESNRLEHTRTLVALLHEHGDRSYEVAPWLRRLIEHPDGSVRYAAIGCVFELEPRRAGTLMARALSKIRDVPPVAASVVVYLSLVSDNKLRDLLPFLDHELREPINWLIGQDYSDWDARFKRGEVSSMVAVAAAGRTSMKQSERLARAKASHDEAVTLAGQWVSERKPISNEIRRWQS